MLPRARANILQSETRAQCFQTWVVEYQWLHTHCTLLGCRGFSHTVPAKEETEAGREEAPAVGPVARSWNPG